MTSSSLPPVPESRVLTPRDPSNTDSDKWPEFQLTDAIAALPGDKSNTKPVSVLLASEHFPLTVTGRLQPPSEGLEHLWLRKDGSKKGTLVVVEDVRSFAYGAYEDGSVEIWAAGKAGWFLIQPRRAYRGVHQQMCAAVKMLFFVVDAYTEPNTRKKGKHAQPWSAPSAEQVFKKYAREQLGDEARSAEAADALYEHRDFLLSGMLAGKEGLAWARNPLFKHLARKFAGDLQAIRERSAPLSEEKPESKAVAHARQDSVDSTSTNSSLKRKRGRPPKNKPADVISIGSSSAASSVKKDLPRRAATEGRGSQKSEPKPRPELVPTRRTRNNTQSLLRSTTPEVRESTTPAEKSDSDDDDDVPARSAGNGKSALRLKRSKPMKGPPKGLSKSGKAPAQADDEPRSSPLPSKRRGDQPIKSRGPKRRNSKQEVDEGIDIPTSPSNNSNPPDDPDADTLARAADTYHPTFSDSLAAHNPDPLQGSTWMCALDGCTHKIYGDPSDSVSQRLIREHYALHAYDDDARVQLVKRLQAPSLPVGHLMERVKLTAKGEGFPGSKVAGTRFPEPLRTKY